jgi:hypothetical protein
MNNRSLFIRINLQFFIHKKQIFLYNIMEIRKCENGVPFPLLGEGLGMGAEG